MAKTEPSDDPRMDDVITAIQIIASLEGQSKNFQSRGKTALSESKGMKSEASIKAQKLLIALIKAAPDVTAVLNKQLAQRKKLLTDGKFGTFAGQFKKDEAAINKIAILSKQFNTALADKDAKIELTKASISYEGMYQYCKTFLEYYFKLAKVSPKISKFKDDDGAARSGATLDTATKAFDFASGMEAMCNNYQSRGKVALKDMKAGGKATKDKKLQKDFDSTSSAIEKLMKAAEKALAEYKVMTHEISNARKTGLIDPCLAQFNDHAPAFRNVKLQGDALAQHMTTVKDVASSNDYGISIVGLLNYRKNFDAHYKGFMAALP